MGKLRIGLVSDYFRAGVAEGAAAYGRAHGVDIDPRWSVRGDWMAEKPGWDGVIAEIVSMPLLEERVLALKLPMILLAPLSRETAAPRVSIDFRNCGSLAYDELVSTGVRSLIVLCSSHREIDQESSAGFIDAASGGGRKVIDPEPVRKAAGLNLPLEELVRLYADSLQEVERPAGVFHPHAGALYSLSIELIARGFRIPEDFSLVAIQKDVQGTAEMAPVPLTTIDPDSWQQGYFAVQLLHRHLSNGESLPLSHHRIPPLGITRRDSTGLPVTRDPAVAKVLHLIHDRFATDLKVDELARLAGVGRRSLEERFRKEMRMTLHDCLMKRRTEEAKKLLRSTPMSISLIAEACGYASVHYFSTAFKRATGKNPVAFRADMGRPGTD